MKNLEYINNLVVENLNKRTLQRSTCTMSRSPQTPPYKSCIAYYALNYILQVLIEPRKNIYSIQLRNTECLMEGYIPAQSYVDVYKTMIYISNIDIKAKRPHTNQNKGWYALWHR